LFVHLTEQTLLYARTENYKQTFARRKLLGLLTGAH